MRLPSALKNLAYSTTPQFVLLHEQKHHEQNSWSYIWIARKLEITSTSSEANQMSTPTSPVIAPETTVRCPYCAEAISALAKKCKHCGEFLDAALRQRRLPTASQQQTWNPGVAAVLSLFIPGAGQMYKGQIGAGFGWLVGTIAGYCLFIVPGLILHIVCIYKAYSDVPANAT